MRAQKYFGTLMTHLSQNMKQEGQDTYNNLQNNRSDVPCPEPVYLMAKALRFKDNTVTIGNTVFSFDTNGITKIKDTGYTLYDFNELLKMNGVTEIKEPKISKPQKTLTIELPPIALPTNESIVTLKEDVTILKAEPNKVKPSKKVSKKVQ